MNGYVYERFPPPRRIRRFPTPSQLLILKGPRDRTLTSRHPHESRRHVSWRGEWQSRMIGPFPSLRWRVTLSSPLLSVLLSLACFFFCHVVWSTLHPLLWVVGTFGIWSLSPLHSPYTPSQPGPGDVPIHTSLVSHSLWLGPTSTEVGRGTCMVPYNSSCAPKLNHSPSKPSGHEYLSFSKNEPIEQLTPQYRWSGSYRIHMNALSYCIKLSQW